MSQLNRKKRNLKSCAGCFQLVWRQVNWRKSALPIWSNFNIQNNSLFTCLKGWLPWNFNPCPATLWANIFMGRGESVATWLKFSVEQCPVLRYWVITREVPYMDDTWVTRIVKVPVNYLNVLWNTGILSLYLIKYWQTYRYGFFLWRCDPSRVMASSFLRFLDHTQRRTTVGRTPLDEWSARRRDIYLTIHNTHNRQTSMPPVGFEPTISAGERPQTYAIDRAAPGTGAMAN